MKLFRILTYFTMKETSITATFTYTNVPSMELSLVFETSHLLNLMRLRRKEGANNLTGYTTR